MRQAARLKVPLLIGHGKSDSTVPVSQSVDMEAALKKAGIPVEAAYYDEQNHSFSSSEDLADWFWHMEKFLAEHNPTDRLTPANVSAFPSKKPPAKGAPPETKAKD